MYKPAINPLSARFCLLLFLFFAGLSATTQAQDTADIPPAHETSPEDTRLTAYFDTTLAEIQDIIAEKQQETALVSATLDTLNQKTNLQKQKLLQIRGMAKLVSGRPYETKGILQELRALSRQALAGSVPATSLLKELAARHAKIVLLASETGQPWTKDLPESFQDTLQGLKKSLNQSARQLQTQQKDVRTALERSRLFTEEVHKAIDSVEQALPEFWKRHLFTSSGQLLSWELWQDVTEDLQSWVGDIPTFLKTQLPASRLEWLDWAGKFLLYWSLMILALLYIRRRIPRMHPAADQGNLKRIYLDGAWGSLALALLGAFFTARYRQTSLQLTLIHLCLFYGTMRIAWTGRIFDQAPPTTSSPLRPLFLLFAGAAVLQLLGLPHPLSRLVWMIFLGISFFLARSLSPSFILEKGLARIHPAVCIALFLLSFSGWQQLSLLTAQIWAIQALFLELALVTTRLLHTHVERLPNTLSMTILKGLLIGFGSPLLWVLSLSGVIGWLGMHLGSDFVFQRISSMNLSWGEYSLNFFRFAVIIVLFYLTHAFGTIWGQILDQKYFRWSRIDPGIITSLRTIGGYAIWIISGIVAINIMGIRMTSLAVIAGGLSVGIGFGLQNLINNFISGLILLFGRTIQAGDVIQIDDLWGNVRKINIRNTEIQTFDNSIMFVPNSELISGRLINWTHRGDFRLRRDVVVGVAYGSDVEQVKKNLTEVAQAHPHVLDTPAPSILFKAFGASSLDFTLRVWIDHIDYALTTLSELHEAVNTAFAEADIEIAFPQMDLHLRDTVPFPVSQSPAPETSDFPDERR